MWGTTARVQWKTPLRLTPRTASHASSVIVPATAPSFHFTSWASRRMPALLTRTSTRPQRSSTAFTPASTEAALRHVHAGEEPLAARLRRSPRRAPAPPPRSRRSPPPCRPRARSAGRWRGRCRPRPRSRPRPFRADPCPWGPVYSRPWIVSRLGDARAGDGRRPPRDRRLERGPRRCGPPRGRARGRRRRRRRRRWSPRPSRGAPAPTRARPRRTPRRPRSPRVTTTSRSARPAISRPAAHGSARNSGGRSDSDPTSTCAGRDPASSGGTWATTRLRAAASARSAVTSRSRLRT